MKKQNDYRVLGHDEETGEEIRQTLTDEEQAALDTERAANVQIMKAFEVELTEKVAELTDLKGSKLNNAIQRLTADIGRFDSATGPQRLAMQKDLMSDVLLIMKGMRRLIQ